MLFSNISSMSLLFDTFLPGKEQRRVGVQAGGISIGDFRNSNIIFGSRSMLECLSRQD
jgi:hypothetical protein